ncbi:hypothetical protein FA15DRAFT_663680 [Coprinopsis marcescibilis]|uniref:SH3 domain-containing protein n=1 Tax=Coprinopsis marcescibilis TaxID=230819 RepID=A0A5C3LNJ1_COPMA|nr:hypothetical protein FA15DRAFT_663680 [Coprinopsis marcescibilis]
MDVRGANIWRMVRVRRQESELSPGSSSPVDTSNPPAVEPSSAPPKLLLPTAAIAGIVSVGVIAIGLGILLWRWRTRMKKMGRISRDFHSSLQKYGIGRGVASADSTDSMQKLEVQGSFFEADEYEIRAHRKSSISFKSPSKSASKTSSPKSPKSPKSPTSGWFSSSSKDGSEKRPVVVQKRPRRSSSYSGTPRRIDESRQHKVQHLANSIRSKPISAPLRIANGPAEPWSPSSPPATSLSAMQSQRPLQPPPPVAYNSQKIRQTPVATDDRQRRLSTSALSSDGSYYSMSSSPDQYPQQQPTAVTLPPPATFSKQHPHGRKPSTPTPLPAFALSYPHGYEPDNYRPGSAGSQSGGNLPRLMNVITAFTPTMDDELPIQVGDTVRLLEEYKDSWCLVQMVGRIDSPRGVVPYVCLQERRRIVPVPVSAVGHKKSNSSIASGTQRR